MVAQTGLFLALRDLSTPTTPSTPWTSLTARRFGGDNKRWTYQLRSEGSEADIEVQVVLVNPTTYNVKITQGSESSEFTSISAQLVNDTTLSTTIEGVYENTTIVSQRPPANTPPSDSAASKERLHLFIGGKKTMLTVTPPKWLQSLGADVASAKGVLKAPMPSLVVELKVKVGDRVEKGQAVVVLESMKTETSLRASTSGVVKAVGCRAGEMVEEGRELVDIEADAS